MSSLYTPSAFGAWRCLLLWSYLLLCGNMAQQLPYNPTHVLRNGSLVYVFQPSSSSTSQFELCSIDISAGVAASDVSYTRLHPALPFLESNKPRPFNPVLDDEGKILVLTGDCAKGASGSELWTFSPQPFEKSGNGTWRQEDISFDGNSGLVSDIGSKYLSAGIAFSAVADGDDADTAAYFFGGMCPVRDVNGANQQSAANYSNLMVTLQPSRSNTRSLDYQMDVSSSRGPPIAEAGFSLTGLLPSFSNRSDGTQTRQQNFVLLGGHTNSAFINTSQVALFSLPQQGWTFVPVSQPDASRTDLAVRTDVSAIEPRSGHSAVLTPDGQRIVVFGGWIGDTDTPADPQLAVLNVGDGYGGQGDWGWTAPSCSGPGLPDGSGIYGHGATMLPGGVMMVAGGYSVSAPNSRGRRRSTSTNKQTLFFNVSSNSWIKEYSPPPEKPSALPEKSGPLVSPSQKAGLGAGLGIGIAVVIGLLAFYLWYTRKLKRQRDLREKQLEELAMGAHRYNLDCLTPGIDGRTGHGDYFDDPTESYFYPTVGPTHNNEGWKRANARDAERTGLLVEIPSPTRGLRRSLSGRATHSTARYDERRVKGSGHIHPIDELEEEHEQNDWTDKTPLQLQPEMTERAVKKGASVFDNAPVLDPFVGRYRRNSEQKTIFHSAPSSPIREDSSPNCQQTAGTTILRHFSPNSAGRVSPTRSSERTGSDLSERSARSNLTSHSTNGSLSRSASMRSAAILNNASLVNPFRTPDGSPTRDTAHQAGSGLQTPVDPRTRSFTSIRSTGRSGTAHADEDSFTTARSSFMQLQAEGEALLGGNPERVRPGTSSTSTGSDGRSYQDIEGSLGRAGTVTAATSLTDGYGRAPNGRERRKSWLGSVRRALSRSTANADRTRSLTTPTTQLEAYMDNPSPARETPASDAHRSFPASAPRRAASDASFWRSKRGKQDWLDDELDPSDPRIKWRRNSGDDWGAPEDVALAEKERQRREWRERSSLLVNLAENERLPTPRTPIGPGELGIPAVDDRPHTPADETDWDVEAAVERRVVQVMFTVPKSKLRVVNADIDRSSILSLPREHGKDGEEKGESSGSPSSGTPNRVKDLAGRFERMGSSPKETPRASPRPSPSPSIRSAKIRAKASSGSLDSQRKASAVSVMKDAGKRLDGQ